MISVAITADGITRTTLSGQQPHLHREHETAHVPVSQNSAGNW